MRKSQNGDNLLDKGLGEDDSPCLLPDTAPCTSCHQLERI
jgi:hypothetical protein